MNIDIWFPVSIAHIDDVISEKENNILIKEILKIKKNNLKGGPNWASNVYNTHNTFDLRKNNKFNNLCDKVIEYVNVFSERLGSSYSHKINSSWFNCYNKNDYQEYHEHNKSIFSAVYFFKTPKDSGNLIFKDPKEPDMFPLENVKYNELSFQQCEYPSIERRLIIFRSYLSHMVKPGNNISPRITAAFNLS
jgi:uncharacterized protein (TIGR02466 family)